MVSCEFLKLFKNTFFKEHLQATASGNSWVVMSLFQINSLNACVTLILDQNSRISSVSEREVSANIKNPTKY